MTSDVHQVYGAYNGKPFIAYWLVATIFSDQEAARRAIIRLNVIWFAKDMLPDKDFFPFYLFAIEENS